MAQAQTGDTVAAAATPCEAPAGTVFVKLGGSVITDKRRERTVRRKVLSRLAAEIGAAVACDTVDRLIVGHGSGSFGHWAARRYRTQDGVRTEPEWRGYAEVAAAAADLNRIVTEAFHSAGVPVLCIQPSASARCEDGRLLHLDTRPIEAALSRGLVPLIYGDVALDSVRGGTIISTEDIFVYLADRFDAARILLAGDVPGVLGADGRVIDRITPTTFPEVARVLSGAAGVDVTGGMANKIARMIELVSAHPRTHVRVLSGTIPGLLGEALREPSCATGTQIAAD